MPRRLLEDGFPARREAIEPRGWPQDAPVAVSLTFDLDAEAGLTGQGSEWQRRLTALSDQRFGVGRGLARVLHCLDEHGARATFYVPGATALRHPDAVALIVDHGHEIAHHGHEHLPGHLLPADSQRDEIVRGIEALESVTGVRPVGYRSPAWELTPETLEVVAQEGFEFDSSLMEDDRPYALRVGDRRLLELPVHWTLDDVPHFQWTPDRPFILASPRDVLELWLTELRSARQDGRHVTYTMHPNVSGRGTLIQLLDGLLAAMADVGAWICTHGQLSERLRSTGALG
jgi:peptidoglycan/xylan/chitin deacetylase (PgdA/CDA1 family)